MKRTRNITHVTEIRNDYNILRGTGKNLPGLGQQSVNTRVSITKFPMTEENFKNSESGEHRLVNGGIIESSGRKAFPRYLK